MPSPVSPPSPRHCVTRARRRREVPGFASLPSFASSAPHDSCNAMQSGAVRCNPDDAAMTQPVTQTQAAWGRNDANRSDGRLAATSPGAGRRRPFPVSRPVSPTSPQLCGRRVPATPGDNHPTAPLSPTWPNGRATGPTRRPAAEPRRGNSRRYRRSFFRLSRFPEGAENQ